ncbi:hypothetical protein MAM1_0095d05020 [Mucor ambiguus]|uniref:Uncharacterized protein n=1 Tax=Mucor ambiguus TaxID=91626 RepID=A0A0C9MDY2_9FUNG|nr:hypothetical protein MAM1_0095d05020 [Mucor ambiguus]
MEYTPSVTIATITAASAATWTLTENEMAIASTTLMVDKPYIAATETTVSVYNSVAGVREPTKIVNVKPPQIIATDIPDALLSYSI